ncbi:MAG: hypothetical protein ACYC5K_10255 [Saccharofermentanales bacterium]
MKKIMISIITLFTAALILGGCATLDVVRSQGKESLVSILKQFPDIEVEESGSDYSAISSDGSTILLVSRDFSVTLDGDLLISTPLKPFTDAGLDAAKLSGNFRADADRLYLAEEFGSAAVDGSALPDFIFAAVDTDRSSFSYHDELDHFGVSLGEGKFEWAKDYTNNDKDIVFILSADPLSSAGVDVQNVEGWIFLVMPDKDGKDMNLLVKPSDLG